MDTSYMALNRRFCRDASGVIMVGDITHIQSIEDTARWKQEVDEIVSTVDSPIPIVLCINKLDKLKENQELEKIQTQDGLEQFAEQNSFIAAYRVSAKEDINISTAFSTLVREMLIKEINEQQELEQNGDYDAEKARANSFNLQ